MDFGVVNAKIDDIGYFTFAEELGFTHGWVTDSQMIRSNPWAVLALVSQATRKMRIGTGVAVSGLRLAPVLANSIATINRLAPGRTFLGVGTGNTAMRMMGQPPMPVKEFDEYLRVVRALIRGEEVDYTLRGRTHPIKFLMRDYNYLDVEHHIPLYVAGMGPRAQGLAGKHGDGLVTNIPRGGTIAQAVANARAGAEAAGRTLDDFHTVALVNMIVLQPGEALNSERVVGEVGASIMANIHYLVDLVKERGGDPPDYVKPIWNDYMQHNEQRPAEIRHQKLHESHYSYLDPAEARFITPEIVKNFCIAGQPEEVVEQLHALEGDGLGGIMMIPPLDRNRQVIEEFARKVIEKY